MGRPTRELILRELLNWRKHAEIIAEAVRRVAPRARVYVFGGAAEGRLTVRSDVDVAVVLEDELGLEEAVELRAKILEEAERLGLPLHAPVEIHIIDMRTFRRLVRGGKALRIR